MISLSSQHIWVAGTWQGGRVVLQSGNIIIITNKHSSHIITQSVHPATLQGQNSEQNLCNNAYQPLLREIHFTLYLN